MNAVLQWEKDKWPPPIDDQDFVDLTARVFGSADGRIWLHQMLDKIYCTVSASNDPYELCAHNGQRSVIHLILQAIDQNANPQKYQSGAVDPPGDPRL